jgi:hypothetical protein
MARKPRDYSREYQRRNELAKQRGFKNYGQQRRYTEYIGQRADWVVFPKETGLPYYPNPRWDYSNYWQGDDPHLDIFLRMARHKGMDEAEAYDRYMRKGNGRELSRGALKQLEMDTFDISESETWY